MIISAWTPFCIFSVYFKIRFFSPTLQLPVCRYARNISGDPVCVWPWASHDICTYECWRGDGQLLLLYYTRSKCKHNKTSSVLFLLFVESALQIKNLHIHCIYCVLILSCTLCSLVWDAVMGDSLPWPTVLSLLFLYSS